MKKFKRNMIITILALALLISLAVVMTVDYLKYEGIILPKDRSAQESHNHYNHTITWKGKIYKLCDYDFIYDVKYNRGKAVTQCSECGNVLYEISGDSNHDFLVDPCFNERDDLYVSEDYVIPTEGEITAVYVNGRKVTNKKLLDAIEKMYSADDSDFFLYDVEENFYHDHNIFAKKVNLSYEDCPVGSEYKGYIGKVDGKWCYFHDYPGFRVNQKETIPCFEIDEELIPIIDKYF
ncbi:MAG: hypothetical protein IJC50_00710 [Clostridia bacterium]|nr:hypothetical protein [Clostridia bacterium]